MFVSQQRTVQDTAIQRGQPTTQAAAAQRLGNQARLRGLNAAPQFKLRIGAVDDPQEAEADRVADAVMSLGAAPPPPSPSASGTEGPTLRRACAACAGKDDDILRRSPAPDSVHQTLSAPGQPLSAQTRAFFEPRLDRDLSGVRVHDDTTAAGSARAVNAQAYTVGQHIVFGEGQYSPGSDSGRRLLAHELAHTIQQSDQPVMRRKLVAGSDAGAVEVAGHINDFCPGSATTFGVQVKEQAGACPPKAASPGCDCACTAMTDAKRTYHINLATMNPFNAKQKLANGKEESVPKLATGPHTAHPPCAPHTQIVIPKSGSTATFGSFNTADSPVTASTPRILAHELCGHGVACQTYKGDTGDRAQHDTTIATENSIYGAKGMRGSYANLRQGESYFQAPGDPKLVFSLKDGLHYETVP
ncbi:hypothetical protein QO010_002176 [Caulobacter ginsengisoli]|uniref:eCIS core domain-containing protein n=1 Tax=Caulobacter ginsengisoli TaxID=400775 RepID=A0ABU0IQU7_9CAUL|nr:DUF4157 domain-containing protein [Caulobacter ginsengisoli]MDQ0464395.1 hypothetical protein [Caulobacter ginsengisoli]